jgi:hydroxyacylglutathione hydrolase
MPLEIELLPILGDNYCFLLHEPKQDVMAVVDPGAAVPVAARLEERGGRLDWILITHHHADHTGGVLELKQRYGCRVAGPAAEAEKVPGLDLPLNEGDNFALGAEPATIIATPGHTKGHISFHFPESKAVFCGDTLFALGCGRLFEGDAQTMWTSLEKLMALSDATRVYCGHEYTSSNARFALSVDAKNKQLQSRAAAIEALRAQNEPTVPSTIGLERSTNPFVRAGNAKAFGRLRALKDQA